MQCQYCQGHQVGTSNHGMTAATMLWSLLLSAILLSLIGCGRSTHRWTSLTDYRWTEFTKDDFPANVDQIITEYGNLLDRRRTAGYGEWNVSVSSEPALAVYACVPNETCQIVVNKLRCANAHSENTACAVHLDVSRKACRLMLSEKKQALSIRCPLDVVLAPVVSAQEREAMILPSGHTAVARY